VHDQVLVGVEQRGADLAEQFDPLRRSELMRIAVLVQRLALDQFLTK